MLRILPIYSDVSFPSTGIYSTETLALFTKARTAHHPHMTLRKDCHCKGGREEGSWL